MNYIVHVFVFFFKQKTAYEMRISDWSSDVCSSDLIEEFTYLQPARWNGTRGAGTDAAPRTLLGARPTPPGATGKGGEFQSPVSALRGGADPSRSHACRIVGLCVRA